MGIHHFICALASIAALTRATPLDDYVWAEDEVSFFLDLIEARSTLKIVDGIF